mgnify:CR=1 FL=1|jgi:branched-chain amino acid transport system permease protein|tara:strand:- start:557 stop:1423 length:867 start_codon:yes stop_codon:yes gene_type:complete
MDTNVTVQIIINAITLGSVYALMALGLTLLYGVMDILFFAHGAMYMLGAYSTFYLCEIFGLNYFFAVPIGVAIIGLFGVLIEKGLFRRIRSDHVSVIFLAIALNWFLESLGHIIFGLKPKSVSSVFTGQINIFGGIISWERVALIFISLIAVGGLYLFLMKTRYGLGMRAYAEDPATAELQGISNDTVCSLGFLIGCGLAALGGILVAPIFVIKPVMGSHAVMMALLVIGFGGLGSIPGALIAALIIGFLESFGTFYFGSDIAWGFIFIIIVIFLTIRPTGLIGVERA